jgi:hypothetical protein
MPSKLTTSPTFKTWWTKHSSSKTKEESWNAKEKCNTLDLKEATQGSVLVLPRRDLISTQVSRVGSQECKLQIQCNNFLSPRSAPLPPQMNNNVQNTSVVGPCYSCGWTGHYTNRCPRKQANQTLAPGTNRNLNRNTNNSATTPARQNQAHARVNHVAVEEA